MNKINGHEGLYKDPLTDVIINRAQQDRSKYIQMKRQAQLNISSQNEISELKQEIDELKTLVNQLIQSNGSKLS
jgi:hypothetical protein